MCCFVVALRPDGLNYNNHHHELSFYEEVQTNCSGTPWAPGHPSDRSFGPGGKSDVGSDAYPWWILRVSNAAVGVEDKKSALKT